LKAWRALNTSLSNKVTLRVNLLGVEMKDRLKEWAHAVRECHKAICRLFPSSTEEVGRSLTLEAADFLQSMADIADQEPCKLNPDDTIRQQYVDWHIKNGMKWLMQVNSLEQELAEAKRRIEGLNNVIQYWKDRAESDQPKPLLADQPDELEQARNTIKLLEQIAQQERQRADEWVFRFDKLLGSAHER